MTTPDFYRIAAYGDSTQWGDGPTAINSPSLLQRLLRAVYHPDFVVENHGVPAIDTANRFNGQVDPATKIRLACSWSDEMANKTAGGCPVDYGGCGTTAYWVINNTCINDVIVSLGKTTPDEFAQFYGQMNQIATSPDNNRRFVIETPNPITAYNEEQLSQFFTYIERQRYIAKAFDVPLIEQHRLLHEFVPKWPQFMLKEVVLLHPNPVLYSAKALLSFWTMYPLMKNDAPPPWAPPRDVFRSTWDDWSHGRITDAEAGTRMVKELPSSLR